MTMSKDEFEAYIKKHKIAKKTIIEAYIAENPKDEYHYDDIDAVYQLQVNTQIGAHTIGRTRQGRVECGHGSTRTMNGTKYGHHYQ
jgi:hypothetical protein